MNTGLTITRGTPEDAAILTATGIEAFIETFAKDNRKDDMDKYIAEEMNIDKITAELLDPDNLFLIARQDNKMIGYAKMRTAKKITALEKRNPIEIERLYVLKAHHEKKIGAALMTRCINYAIENNFDTIWLGVWEFNHRAVAFYKKWGFEFFGSHTFRLGDDLQTDQLMMKGL